MATIDDLVTQGSVMPDNLRSDTVRASLEYKNQLKKAGDIYVGTGTKITNDEGDVKKEIYVTEGKNIQKALNEDIFRVGGKNNIGLTNSDLSGYSNNIGIGKDISIIGNNNILIGNGAKTPIFNEYAVIIGDKASSLAGGITIGRNAVSTGTNVVTIGDNADNKAESGIVIGSASATSTAVSGIALGGSAQVEAPNAVQIGKGVNLVENSLQFHTTQIVGGDGHVNATKIKGVLSTDIFESDKKTVKNATNAINVTGTIDGRLITDIFDGNTTTVQTAARLDVRDYVGNESHPVYFENGMPKKCKTQILTVGSGIPSAAGLYGPGVNKVDLGPWELFVSDLYYSITAIMATIDSTGKDTEVTKYEDWFSANDLNLGINKVITYKGKPYTLKVDDYGKLVFEGPSDTIEVSNIAVHKYPIKCIRVFEIS